MTVGETLASPHEDHDGRSTNTVTFLITLSFHVELIKQVSFRSLLIIIFSEIKSQLLDLTGI